MPVKFVPLEANEPEPAGHREVRDAAFTSPAGCGAREGTMTFIDADKLFAAEIGEVPVTFEYASRKLKETPGGGGVLKRLMAGVRSATQRGVATRNYGITPIGDPTYRKNGTIDETVQTVRFEAYSLFGRWSDREWNFISDIEVAVDEDCNESFSVLDYVGKAIVSSKDGSDPTEFRGQCVAHFALEIFHRCLRHRFAMNTVYPVAATTKPEWRSRALKGLAQIAEYAEAVGDNSGLFGLTNYLSHQWCDRVDETSHVLMLDHVTATIGTREQASAVGMAYATWKDNKISDLGDEIEKVIGWGKKPYLLGCIDFEDVFREAANNVAVAQLTGN